MGLISLVSKIFGSGSSEPKVFKAQSAAEYRAWKNSLFGQAAIDYEKKNLEYFAKCDNLFGKNAKFAQTSYVSQSRMPASIFTSPIKKRNVERKLKLALAASLAGAAMITHAYIADVKDFFHGENSTQSTQVYGTESRQKSVDLSRSDWKEKADNVLSYKNPTERTPFSKIDPQKEVREKYFLNKETERLSRAPIYDSARQGMINRLSRGSCMYGNVPIAIVNEGKVVGYKDGSKSYCKGQDGIISVKHI